MNKTLIILNNFCKKKYIVISNLNTNNKIRIKNHNFKIIKVGNKYKEFYKLENLNKNKNFKKNKNFLFK